MPYGHWRYIINFCLSVCLIYQGLDSILAIIIFSGNDNLTYEESEKRLILLGLIFAVCLLSVSTAFVLIIVRIYGKYKTPILMTYEPGMVADGLRPIPSVLMISDSGHIVEFSYLHSRFSSNGLPNMKKLPSKVCQNIYAFENKGSIYFLSTSMDRNVVRYDIDEKHHHEISHSKIQNLHCPSSAFTGLTGLNLYISMRTFGVRIGNYFWIMWRKPSHGRPKYDKMLKCWNPWKSSK